MCSKKRFFFFFFFFFFFSCFQVANGSRILVSRRGRDGNFVQFAKKILGSGVDQDGDHCRTYVDSSGKFSFHVLVNQGLSFLCFARNELDKGACFDFLYDLAAAFVEQYAASLDEQVTNKKWEERERDRGKTKIFIFFVLKNIRFLLVGSRSVSRL